jgi:hypothetical protein
VRLDEGKRFVSQLAVFVLGDLPKFSGANSFDDRWYWP